MTDFKAPPVPPQPFNEGTNPSALSAVPEAPVSPAPTPAGEQAPVKNGDAQPNGLNLQENVQKIQEKTAELHQKFDALPDPKKNLIIYAAMFVLGLCVGGLLFHGSGEQSAPLVKGLQGVAPNPDIKEKLSRCGTVAPSSPCVLYVMNSYNYDKLAEDFFDTAVALTQRPDFLIRTDNVRYAKTRIKPGYFAEIKIPMKR